MKCILNLPTSVTEDFRSPTVDSFYSTFSRTCHFLFFCLLTEEGVILEPWKILNTTFLPLDYKTSPYMNQPTVPNLFDLPTSYLIFHAFVARSTNSGHIFFIWTTYTLYLLSIALVGQNVTMSISYFKE